MTSSSLETTLRSAIQTEFACRCGSRNLTDLGPCRVPGLSGCSDFETELSQQVDPGRLYRCRECHLGLRLPRPLDTVIASLYESLPVTRWKKKPELAGSAQRYLAKMLGQSNGLSLKVLDVGAFDGSFLKALPASFCKMAIEPCDAAAQLEADRIRVLKPFLEPATETEAGQFDVVTMFDVFEHLSDPIQGMKSAISYVRPGGRLFVGTGNMDHWSWRQTQGTHWYLDPIQHIVVGSRRHFEWQASQLGASTCRILTFSHQPGSISQRFSQALTTIYFGARKNSGWSRAVVRLMNCLPGFRRLSNKQVMPYTQQLHDHLLAEYVRGNTSA